MSYLFFIKFLMQPGGAVSAWSEKKEIIIVTLFFSTIGIFAHIFCINLFVIKIYHSLLGDYSYSSSFQIILDSFHKCRKLVSSYMIIIGNYLLLKISHLQVSF